MFLDKKFFDKDHLGRLAIGVLRFDYDLDEDDMSLISLAKLMSYILDHNVDIINVLTQVYETEHPVYLKILGSMILLKLYSPHIDNNDMKQKLIDQYEKKVDAQTFQGVFQFITTVFKYKDSSKISSITLNEEYEKLFKYILLNKNLKNISQLYSEFYEKPESIEQYDTLSTEVFQTYQTSIISKDIILDDINDVTKALKKAEKMDEEIREVEIFKDIKFIEKKRVAILVGVSGTGKSMSLCHCTGEYLTKPISNNKKNLLFYFTFENSQEETFVRIMANVLEIPIDDIKIMMQHKDTCEDLVREFFKKKDPNTILKIVELEPKKHSMAVIEAEIKKELLKYDDAVVYSVILDYVDKMVPVDRLNKFKQPHQQLGDIVDDFKSLVKVFECSGLTVSQVNRIGAKKAKQENETWDVTDIGGSWEKVEYADIVILMDVEKLYEELGYNIVTLINAKHRYFQDGTVISAIMKPQIAKYFKAPDNIVKSQLEQTPSQDSTGTDIDAKTILI
jgi:hypothetical protein